MKVVIVYARLYADCLGRALSAIGKNAWTLLLPVILVIGLLLSARLVAPLGLVGGIIVTLVRSALLSSYLYFVGEVVSHSKVSITEFRRSIGVFFWSVVNLFFVLWIADLLLGAMVRDQRTLFFVSTAIDFLVFVMMPSLEVIALRGMYGGLAILQRAFDFLQQHWIEWFIPNLLIGGIFYLLLFHTPLMALNLLFVGLPLGILLHVAMVFRGFVFNALDGSSHRQRMFKYRNQTSS